MNSTLSVTVKGIYSLLLVLFLCWQASAQVPAITYQSPQVYTINKAITPLTPTNTGGAVPATVYGQVSTIARNFNIVTGVAVDAAGNVYVDDYDNNQIKKVTPAGVVSVFAGSGASGFTDGQGMAATFNQPDGITIDKNGNLYVSDQSNHSIRKITPGGLVSTLAGGPFSGSNDGTGMNAKFYYPKGLGIDELGNIYVADNNNNLIKKVTPAGVVTTIAGTGTASFVNGVGRSAGFNSPTGVEADVAGNLYIADAGNDMIRKMTSAGVVTTFATGMSFPREVRIDAAGNFYVTNQTSNQIKKISPAGVVTTLAGTGSPGSTDGKFNVATFYQPIGLALDAVGNLYVGDAYNSSVRKITVTGYAIDKALPAGLVFDATTGKISGTPAILSPATNYTVSAYNVWGSSSTVVNIEVALVAPPKASIITFPPPVIVDIGPDNILHPNATSTNNETPITYTSSNPAVAYIGADGAINVIAPGVTIITASQSGNANYLDAIPVSQTYTIKQDQVILFPAIAVKTTCDADFNAGALSTNPTIPLTYTSSNDAVATISAQGLIHILKPGSTTITVNQQGSDLFIPAQPQTRVLTVEAPVVPVVSVSASFTSTCAGSATFFTADILNKNALSNNLIYQWKINGVNAGTNNSRLDILEAKKTDFFECVVTNNTACPTTGTSNKLTNLEAVAYFTPTVAIFSSVNNPFCSGTSIVFTAQVTNEGINPTYQWKVNGIAAGENKPTFTTTTLADMDVVTCDLTNISSSCTISRTVTSNAFTANVIASGNPPPSVSIKASTNNVMPGTLIAFTATPANAGTVTKYQWQVNGVNVGLSSSVYSSKNLTDGDIITCIITSNIPCSLPVSSNGLRVTFQPALTIKIPNTFTPNGDGVNDNWSINDLLTYPNCLISIFNRLGNLIYQSKGYTKPWDGTSNGKTMPVSTYYYVIDLGNKSQQLSGFVTIIR